MMEIVFFHKSIPYYIKFSATIHTTRFSTYLPSSATTKFFDFDVNRFASDVRVAYGVDQTEEVLIENRCVLCTMEHIT